ncbi:MAG: hypothetical protein IPK00_00495 [Deltaproteobacteria bacterium]|nr:hypothetical protein [Deltaproteobacteria bacterium]
MACEQRRDDGIARPGGRLRAIRILLSALGIAIASAGVAASQTPVASPAAGKSGSSAVDAPATLDIPGRGAPRGSGGARDPGLDDLLRLPSDFETKPAERPVAGASEDEWRQRFVRAEKAIGDAREALVETKKELDGLAEDGGGSQWSVAPPGASGQQTTSPLSFKLRQQLQRDREALDQAEKALRELRIEADLAGVPAEWRMVASSPPPPTNRTAPN